MQKCSAFARGTLPKGQWRRQRSKEARSFRGQKILQPGHPTTFFLVVALKTQAANAVSNINK